MYLNVPVNHFRKIKFDRLTDGLQHRYWFQPWKWHIYCFFNCRPHVLSAWCPVGLVSCQPRVLSASCLSAWCPVGLVSCRPRVLSASCLSAWCPVGLVSCQPRVLSASCLSASCLSAWCPVSLVSCRPHVLSASCLSASCLSASCLSICLKSNVKILLFLTCKQYWAIFRLCDNPSSMWP